MRKTAGRGRLLAALTMAATLVAAPTSAQAQGASAEAPHAATTYGPVVGTRDDDVLVFKGVPYAAAPTGELRWRPPAEPAGWTRPRQATTFAPACPGGLPARKDTSEDCLYLNVWTPQMGAQAKRPVMVWIYGGGFRGGSTALPIFNGRALAQQGVVLVSFGYRVGALGFLATSELSAESPHGASGNYGVLDAVAALRWVQENIAAFGGDPQNVTVLGQSSGSETVNILTASPLARGLFAKAIGESGSSFGVRAALPLREAEALGKAFMAERSVTSLAALRKLPTDKLLIRDDQKYEPNVDGWLLPRSVREIYLAGAQNDVPMIIGGTTQEFGRPPEISREALNAGLQAEYGPLAPAIATAIGADGEADPTDARWRLTNVEWGNFTAAMWSGLQTKTGRAPVYRYVFDYAPPQPAGRPRTAHHGAELAYIFGNYRPAGRTLDAEEQMIHRLLSGYWLNFARTGNPNGAGLPQWPAHGVPAHVALRFGAEGAAPIGEREPVLLDLIDRHYHGEADEADQTIKPR
ncbi:para-nitrobenzyl esterase [Sphingobium sp. B1D7B]|nr:para-nitrobenzyl esterase [Sphingobium sp. B1D7B]